MLHHHMVKKKDGSSRLIHAIKFEWIAQGWSRAIIGLCDNDASATGCGTISVIIIYGDLGWIMYEQQGGLCVVYQTLGQQSFIKLSQAIKNMMDLTWNVLVQREARTHNGWFSQKIGLTIKSWQSWDLWKHVGTFVLKLMYRIVAWVYGISWIVCIEIE